MSEISKETIEQLVESLYNAKQAQDDLTAKNKEAKDAADKTKDMWKQLGGSVLTFGKTMTSAQEGTGKYAQATSEAANAAGDLVGQFGPLGKAIGGVIKVLGMLIGGSLKQNDTLIKSYQDMSRVGANYSTSMREVLSNLQKFGIAVEEADKLSKLLSSVSPELAMLADSAGLGNKKLAEVFNYTLGATELKLAQLGYTTDEMRERTAQYVASESMNSRIRSKTTAQLNAETVTYMTTLAELSMLTGESRDAYEKERRQQENDLRFQMYLNTLDDKEREKARTLIMSYAKVYGKDAADGMKSILVNQGRVADQFGSATYQLVGDQGIAGAMAVMKSSGDTVDDVFNHLKDVSPRIKELYRIHGPTIAVNGEMKALGLNIQSYRGSLMMEGKTRKALEEIRQQTQKQETDDRIGETTKMTIAERQLRNAFEVLTYMVGTGAVPTISTLATVGTAFARVLAKVSAWFGGPDLTDAFTQISDLEDANRVQAEQVEKLNRLKKEEITLQKEINEKMEAQKKHPQSSKELGIDIRNARERLQNNRTEQSSTGEVIQRAEEAQSRFKQSSDPLKDMPFQTGKPDATKLDPKLITAMQQIREQVGGFSEFTSTIRPFGENKNSKHPLGKAVDFKLNYTPTVEQGREIVNLLNSMGLKGKDEYNERSPDWSGPHIHAELKARTGGIFSGPESGYNVQLHGKEAIVPLASSQGIEGVTKHSLSSGGFSGNFSSDNFMRKIAEMLDMRLADVIDELRRSNDTQGKILSAAK